MFKFIKLIRAEIKNITWPTRRAVLNYSFLVIIISILMSLYLFTPDTLLKKTILKINTLFPSNNNISINPISTTTTTTTTDNSPNSNIEINNKNINN